MAKKHLKENIKNLAVIYSDVQQQYEIAAESLSNSMIAPEIYNKFAELKSKIDTKLSNYSILFSEALQSRENFLKSYKKESEAYHRLRILSEQLSLEKDNTSEAYIQQVEKQISDCLNKLSVYSTIDEISCVKNRENKHKFALTYFDILLLLETLKTFIKEEL